MAAKVLVVRMYDKVRDLPGFIVNTTSKAENDWQRDLSPFHLGPCELYDGHVSKNMENAWQYSKVYKNHTGESPPTVCQS
jgi:hypothetical protein